MLLRLFRSADFEINCQYLGKRRGASLLYTYIHLYQLRVPFDCLFNPSRLDAYIALRDGGARVQQQPLNKRDIVTVALIDFRRIPFPEAVSADALIAEIVADKRKLLLNGPLRDREDKLIRLDTAAQTEVLNVLLDDKRNGEGSALPGLLLNEV